MGILLDARISYRGTWLEAQRPRGPDPLLILALVGSSDTSSNQVPATNVGNPN